MTVEYKEKKIGYRTIGSGKTVMLVHGFGEDSRVWDQQVEFLKKNCFLIVPELPGTGDSEFLEDMSMEGMAGALAAILENEKKTDCLMIGHSMGGYITLAFASLFPEKLKAFGLFHSTAFADSEEKKETRRKGIVFIRQNGAFSFLKTTTPNMYSQITKENNTDLIETHINSLHNFSAETLVTYYEAMINRPDRTEVLKTSKIPVLFVAGKYDNAAPLADVLKQCHLPELSYFHVLDKSGHMGMMEEVEKSNRILEEFLL